MLRNRLPPNGQEQSGAPFWDRFADRRTKIRRSIRRHRGEISCIGFGRTLVGFVGLLPAQSPPQFTVTDIGVLPGLAVSQATALSSNGTVVGYSASSGFQFYGSPANGSAQAWIYSNSVVTPLPKIQTATIPLTVNATGQVVGIYGSSERDQRVRAILVSEWNLQHTNRLSG